MYLDQAKGRCVSRPGENYMSIISHGSVIPHPADRNYSFCPICGVSWLTKEGRALFFDVLINGTKP